MSNKRIFFQDFTAYASPASGLPKNTTKLFTKGTIVTIHPETISNYNADVTSDGFNITWGNVREVDDPPYVQVAPIDKAGVDANGKDKFGNPGIPFNDLITDFLIQSNGVFPGENQNDCPLGTFFIPDIGCVTPQWAIAKGYQVNYSKTGNITISEPPAPEPLPETIAPSDIENILNAEPLPLPESTADTQASENTATSAINNIPVEHAVPCTEFIITKDYMAPSTIDSTLPQKPYSMGTVVNGTIKPNTDSSGNISQIVVTPDGYDITPAAMCSDQYNNKKMGQGIALHFVIMAGIIILVVIGVVAIFKKD